MKNIFDATDAGEVISRINGLTAETQAQWGKMDVAQMLAHCNVTYEMVFEDKHKKPNAILRLILKLAVKNTVVNDVPYSKNGRTAPAFVIADEKSFDAEKTRLIDHINRVVSLGESHFDGAESHSFGPLAIGEWNNMFYKHLDHHLKQFGA